MIYINGKETKQNIEILHDLFDEIPRQVLDEMYPDALEIDFDKYYTHSMTAGMIVRTNEIPSYIVHDYVNKFRSNLATNMRIL